MKRLIFILFTFLTFNSFGQSWYEMRGPLWIKYQYNGVVDSVKVYFSGYNTNISTSKTYFNFTKPILVPGYIGLGNSFSINTSAESTGNFWIAGSSGTIFDYIDAAITISPVTNFANNISVNGVVKTGTDTLETVSALRDSVNMLLDSIADLHLRTQLAQNISSLDTTRWGEGDGFGFYYDTGYDGLAIDTPLISYRRIIGYSENGIALQGETDNGTGLDVSTGNGYNIAKFYNNSDNGDSIALRADGTIHQYYGGNEVLYTTIKGDIGLKYNSLYNTAIGDSALNRNIVGSGNTAIGYQSMLTNKGNSNTSIGYTSLDRNSTGGANVAIGSNALGYNLTGSNNTSIGADNMSNSSTGSSNVSIGNDALGNNSSGSYNIALGSNAGGDNGSLSYRLYIGSLNRANLADDTIKSIIYGFQDAVVANQKLYLNAGNVYIAGEATATIFKTATDTAAYKSDLRSAHVGIDFFDQSIATALTINDTIHLSNATNDLYEVGNFHHPGWNYSNDTLTCTQSGHYEVSISLSVRSVGGGGEYKLIYKLNDLIISVMGEETTGSSQLKTLHKQVMLDIETGDKLWFDIVNITSSNDINIENLSITITQVHRS